MLRERESRRSLVLRDRAAMLVDDIGVNWSSVQVVLVVDCK